MTKKIFLAIAFVASVLVSCTDDYKDWADPQTVGQPETVSFGDGSISTVGVIDFNSVTDEVVKVCNITAPTASNADFSPEYTITIGDQTFPINSDGTMSAEDLQNYVVSLYGRRPVEHTVDAIVSMYLSNGLTTVKTATSEVFHITVIPKAPEIESAYYITGSINGWDNNNTDYKLTNGGGDPYENPVFTVTIPAPADGGNVEFKVTPASGIGGDWSKCLAAAATEGRFNYNNDGGNFVIEAVEGTRFYVLTFNMLDQEWSYEALPAIEDVYYLVGTMNGWDINGTEWALTNGGLDPYEHPVFRILLPAEAVGSELKFKVVPQSGLGDWNTCLAAGDTEGKFVAKNAGSDFIGEVVEGAMFYRIEFNMLEFTYKITALNFAEFIYERGVNTSWGDNPARPLWGGNFDGKYEGYMWLNGEFKFMPNSNNWDGDWESAGDNKIADNGGSNCPAPETGFYVVNVDLGEMTYKLTKIDFIDIVGGVEGGASDWSSGPHMTYNEGEGCWEADVTFTGQFKFRGNGNWGNEDGNFGGSLDNIINGSNDNLFPSITGQPVHVKLFLFCNTKSYVEITAN